MVEIELEHMLGFSGKHCQTLEVHPQDSDTIIYAVGSVVVIGDLKDAHNQQFLRRHDNEVSCIRVSPSGKFIASAQIGTEKRKGKYATIIVWDFQKRKILHALEGHTNRVLSLSFSHDERFLVSLGEHEMCVWNLESGEFSGGYKSTNMDYSCYFAEFAPQQPEFNPRRPRYMIVSGTSKNVKVHQFFYDVKQMNFQLTEEICSLPGKIAGFKRQYNVTRTDEKTGAFFYAGTFSGELMIFQTANAIFRTSVQCSNTAILSMVVCGESVYIGTANGKVKRWHGYDKDWQEGPEVQLSGSVTSLSLDADGKVLLAGTDTGKMYQLQTRDLSHVKLEDSHIMPITSVSFDPKKNEVFCTASEDGTVRLWDLSDYRTLCNFKGPTEVTCCTYFKDMVLSGWRDGFIRMFDTKSRQLKWQIPNAHKGGVTAIQQCDLYIVSGGEDGAIRLWSTSGSEMLAQYEEHKRAVTGIVIDIASPDIIHSCSADKTAITFDLKRSRKIAYHVVTDKVFTSMSQRKDSENEIVCGKEDGTIAMYDVDYPEAVKVIEDPLRAPVRCVQVSPTGQYLACGGDSEIIVIWDLRSYKVLCKCMGHSASVRSLCWSPDEKQLISVGQDAAICIFNVYK